MKRKANLDKGIEQPIFNCERAITAAKVGKVGPKETRESKTEKKKKGQEGAVARLPKKNK